MGGAPELLGKLNYKHQRKQITAQDYEYNVQEHCKNVLKTHRNTTRTMQNTIKRHLHYIKRHSLCVGLRNFGAPKRGPAARTSLFKFIRSFNTVMLSDFIRTTSSRMSGHFSIPHGTNPFSTADERLNLSDDLECRRKLQS